MSAPDSNLPLSEIQVGLREAGLDGWLFFDHHHRDPLAYRVLRFEPAQSPTRRWFYYVPASGIPQKLVHRIESRILDALPGESRHYAGWESLEAALRVTLAGAKRIAMQYSPHCAVPYVAMVDAGTIELVRSAGVDVLSSQDLVQRFEAVWDATQLDTHQQAGRKVDDILQSAFREIGSAISARRAVDERSIQVFIQQAFDREGLTTDHGPIVAVNANASDPHYEPSDSRSAQIHRNDLVLIDLWAKLRQPRAVYYDITWTGCCGVPTDEMARRFDIVASARDAAIRYVEDAVRQGYELRGFQVDDAARDVIRTAGLGEYFFHRTGHSIGESVHGTGANMDNLETHDDRLVIPRTCFSIEPGVYLPDFGIRSEVNMFVSAGDATVTGPIQRQLVLIGE
jgi:Xaa-Pro aminopeptidase